MSKKGFGKIITFAAILGAVAAGISYFAKYKSFHKELEEDFHDFEDEFDEDAGAEEVKPAENEHIKRNYVPIHREEDVSEAEDTPADEIAAENDEEEPVNAAQDITEEEDGKEEDLREDNIVSFGQEGNVTVSEEE